MKKVLSIFAVLAMACFLLFSIGCADTASTRVGYGAQNVGHTARRVVHTNGNTARTTAHNGNTVNRVGRTTTHTGNAVNRVGNTTAHAGSTADVRNISLSQYDRINNGMAYSEVRDVFGHDGVRSVRDGQELYTWASADNVNAEFYFENGRLIRKNHTGLK